MDAAPLLLVTGSSPTGGGGAVGSSGAAPSLAIRPGQTLSGRVVATDGDQAVVDFGGNRVLVRSDVALSAGAAIRVVVAQGDAGSIQLRLVPTDASRPANPAATPPGTVPLAGLLEAAGVPDGARNRAIAAAVADVLGAADQAVTPQAVRQALTALTGTRVPPEQLRPAVELALKGLPVTPETLAWASAAESPAGADAGTAARIATLLAEVADAPAAAASPTLQAALAAVTLPDPAEATPTDLAAGLSRLASTLRAPEAALVPFLSGQHPVSADAVRTALTGGAPQRAGGPPASAASPLAAPAGSPPVASAGQGTPAAPNASTGPLPATGPLAAGQATPAVPSAVTGRLATANPGAPAATDPASAFAAPNELADATPAPGAAGSPSAPATPAPAASASAPAPTAGNAPGPAVPAAGSAPVAPPVQPPAMPPAAPLAPRAPADAGAAAPAAAAAAPTPVSVTRLAGTLPLPDLDRPRPTAGSVPERVAEPMKTASLGIKDRNSPPPSGGSPPAPAPGAAPTAGQAALLRAAVPNLTTALQEALLSSKGATIENPNGAAGPSAAVDPGLRAIASLLDEVRSAQVANGPLPGDGQRFVNLPLLFQDGSQGELSVHYRQDRGGSPQTSGGSPEASKIPDARVVFHLKMEHLGAVDVDLLLAGGQVNLRIDVPAPEIEGLMAPHLPELVDGLRKVGLGVNALGLHAPAGAAPATAPAAAPAGRSAEPPQARVDLRL